MRLGLLIRLNVSLMFKFAGHKLFLPPSLLGSPPTQGAGEADARHVACQCQAEVMHHTLWSRSLNVASSPCFAASLTDTAPGGFIGARSPLLACTQGFFSCPLPGGICPDALHLCGFDGLKDAMQSHPFIADPKRGHRRGQLEPNGRK